MRNCLGGFDNRRGKLLYSGTQEEIRQETRHILETYRRTFGNTDGLMLGADCSFLPDFETERFCWVTEALREWEREGKAAFG